MMKFIILFFLSGLISINCPGQECIDFQKLDNCKISIIYRYVIYLQHKNAEIGIHDTLTYNIAFSGNRDYIISFCTDQIYYPINIRLLQPETGRELFNNASDDYNESIVISLSNTQNIILVVNLLADKLGKDRIKKNEKACVGLDLQWKKISSNLE